MPANQDFDAPGTTGGDFVIPESPVVVPDGCAAAGETAVLRTSRCRRPGLRRRSRRRHSIALTTTRIAGLARLSSASTLPQDDAPTDLLGKLVSSTPPWFISLIVHFSIMIFLGLLVLGANAVSKKDGIEVDLSHANEKDNEIYAETLGEQLDRSVAEVFERGIGAVEGSGGGAFFGRFAAGGGSARRSAGDGAHSRRYTCRSGTIPTPSIALELSGREEGMKKTLLKAYGGTALTEDAVKLGLSWLVRQQRSRGHVELARSVQERRQRSKTKKPRPRWRSSHFKAPATRHRATRTTRTRAL